MLKKKAIVVNYVAKHSYPYVYKMVEAIANNNEITIAIVSSKMQELPEWRKINNLTIIEVEGYSSYKDFLPNLFKFRRRYLSKIISEIEKYDDIVVFDPMFTYWSYHINKCIKEYKYVYVLHDPIPHSKKLVIHNIMNEKLVKRAYKVVLLSESFRQYTMSHYHKKNADIIIIPEGSNLQIDRNKAVHLIEYQDNKTYFLLQGRIDKYKGIEILAKAYRRLHEEYDNIALVIAGSGDLSAYTDELNELKDVYIVNRWLSNEEVIGFYNDKNVIAVLPYISATQSGVINVAMPCGTPIIASNCGGIPEQIQDGFTGYLVEPGNVDVLYNKMKYVIDNDNELDIIRENAYRRVKELDWSMLAKRFLECI